MLVVKVENVTRSYAMGEVNAQALRGVSLEIESGEFTALVGPSGSGKTTLMQLIGCLDLPTSGKVYVNGQDVSTLNRDQRAEIRQRNIGFIFQFFALIPTLSAYENVELPLLLSNGARPAERRERVMHLLDMVGMAERVEHRPDQMSGGEQQRVAVARSLVMQPKLVLADEPTASLDTANGHQVMDIMTRLNQETGVTFVFATHDPRTIEYARRKISMRDGAILSNGQGPAAETEKRDAR